MTEEGFQPPYSQITADIRVSANPIYLEEQSSPLEGRYVWAYQIWIENLSQQRVQLLNRYWHITDARGQVQEVSGPGVVGEQPVLEPGERFEYTSGCPLSTPSGVMVGHYEMVDREGRLFKVSIPAFSLDSPHQAVHLN
ncbi:MULTISPECIES: Co2+/Mg2+ efflux protein ApaG [Limibacillus]|jgi:ApaG protein|uniref:Protein ApaG n=1 Tax=Limibacillus halophilus TaxID=1579333 RepID=A0A839SZ34_9PROT|nr:Co2+/Mg2+ efflux protein ApaG [Limibacillus halophilus]MBB3066305.1 ApaG protein [Limibacillus halophilus]